MADSKVTGSENATTDENSGDKTTAADNDNNARGQSSLEQFIVENYEQQKSEGRHVATDSIDDERTANFYKRAIGESRRMCTEVDKSVKKLSKLHSELGADNFAAWRSEHAAEVLLPEEAEKIALAEQIYAQN